MEFIKNPYGTNEILDISEDVYVSFNAEPSCGVPPFQSDTGGAETALCFRGGDYFVLNGDFRKHFLACGGDMEKIKQVYIDNIDKQSTWSTDRTNEELIGDFIKKFKLL